MPDINLLTHIRAPRERAYRIICSPAGIRMWWAVDVDQKDDELLLGFDHGSVRLRMRTVDARSPELLEWECVGDQDEWLGTRLTWSLRTVAPAETWLRFTHANWKSATDYMARCGYTWVKVLDRLAAAARSGDPYPYFTE